jgi:hypothetical protein
MRGKRLLVVAGGILALAVIAGVVTLHARPGGVSLARRAFIHPGMTQAEVEAVLGGPPGDYALQPLVYTRIETVGDLRGPRSATWRADDGRLEVVFDEEGKVRGMTCLPGSATRAPTLSERVRDWFRKLWP